MRYCDLVLLLVTWTQQLSERGARLFRIISAAWIIIPASSRHVTLQTGAEGRGAAGYKASCFHTIGRYLLKYLKGMKLYLWILRWSMVKQRIEDFTTVRYPNWSVAQYSTGSTIDTWLMPCIRGQHSALHSRADLALSDASWVSWSHHLLSEGGAPSVGERSSEMVTNATNCRDCQPLMDLQRWKTSDSFVITECAFRWAVLWKLYLWTHHVCCY